MKTRYRMIAITLLAAGLISCGETGFHGSVHEQAPASFSMRDNDFALCGQEFWDDLYDLTVEIFSEGVANVTAGDYSEQVFVLVRSSEQFGDSADEFIDHIKDAPGQLIEIIREDSAVLDSCENFSVALVGPP